MSQYQFSGKLTGSPSVLGLRVLASILIAAMIGISCLWPREATAATPALKIAVNPWMASALDAQIAQILLQEKLGYQVELISIDENAQFPALAKGDLDATLEIWPSGHVADHRLYVEQQRTVEDAGPL